jgi:hypothetical protein
MHREIPNLRMPLTTKVSPVKKNCASCAFVMPTDSSTTELRCGYSYYKQPAVTRKQERMDTYPEVAHDASCGHWTDHFLTILQ